MHTNFCIVVVAAHQGWCALTHSFVTHCHTTSLMLDVACTRNHNIMIIAASASLHSLAHYGSLVLLQTYSHLHYLCLRFAQWVHGLEWPKMCNLPHHREAVANSVANLTIAGQSASMITSVTRCEALFRLICKGRIRF